MAPDRAGLTQAALKRDVHDEAAEGEAEQHGRSSHKADAEVDPHPISPHDLLHDRQNPFEAHQ